MWNNVIHPQVGDDGLPFMMRPIFFLFLGWLYVAVRTAGLLF